MYLSDSGGDGLPDGTEDANKNALFPEPRETNPRGRDSDLDNYEDGIEVLISDSDPLNPTDPVNPCVDSDGDAVPFGIDPDDNKPDFDGDRFLDGFEAAMGQIADVSDPTAVPQLGDVDENGLIDNGDAQQSLEFFGMREAILPVDRSGQIIFSAFKG